MKQISWSIISMLVTLILFAGCSKDDEGGAKPSLAQLYAATVNCNATTNYISTQGTAGLICTATIVSQGETAWCSFDLNMQKTEISGDVGNSIFLYLQPNTTDYDRTATIDVIFNNNYSTTLTLTQTKYSVSADYDKAWAEQPLYEVNSNYIYKTYFTNLNGYKWARNYSICYDTSKRVAHWVAYPLCKAYTTPSVSRTDKWAYDPNNQLPVIPDADQAYIVGNNYFKGYSRGHQCPSADRYNTVATNEMTFYATNLMPQNGSFNGGVWVTLENGIRNNMNKMVQTDTLYVVTGTFFGDSRTTTDGKNKAIAVPSNCWKVLLRTKASGTGKAIQDCTADELIGIGFWFKNDASNSQSLGSYAKSIAEIEKLTGFTFFRNLSPEVAASVKAQNNFSVWGF